MHALVTGGSGFLGLYLVEQLLARGDCVRALCRTRDRSLDRLGVETVLADVRDREATMAACRGVDVVFHLAGIAGIGGPWHRYCEINFWGTRHVVDGCLRHGVGRLVYTSSPSVTFDGSDQQGVDESAPYCRRWFSHYAQSKALAERHVLAASGIDGLVSCALRPHLIWGPRDRHLIPRLLELARHGRLRRVGDGTNMVDNVYVENAAEAHLLAAEALRPGSPVAGRAYFISQGEPVNCWRWINDILALAGLPPVERSVPLAAAWAIGRLWELLYRTVQLKGEPVMTRFLAAQLARSHWFDIRRARQDLSYQPRISTAEGMQRLGESLRGTGEQVSKRAGE
ncbi:MAG: NAD-dependent epimerase/dehydratase family protein [Thermoguttaceae bacterium]|jgi:nucleoside-diphosphate-sugar epimerase